MRDAGPVRSYLSSRTPWIAVLLLASLGLVAVLAVQAQYGVYGHRVLAEEVLRDYAALAADELLRRVSAEVGYYGYAPATTILRQVVRESGSFEGLHAEDELDERSRRALELVRWPFLFRPGDRSVTGPAGDRREAFRKWLASELPQRADVSPSSGFASSCPRTLARSGACGDGRGHSRASTRPRSRREARPGSAFAGSLRRRASSEFS